MPAPRALLIVDVQEAFSPPPAFVKRIEVYAKRFEVRIFTQFVNTRESMFRKVPKQTTCKPEDPEVALCITPRKEDLVIRKHTYGLLPKDITRIKRLGVKKITLCGLDTDACVLGVMFSLFDAGIACQLKENLCWSSSGLHKPAMQIIRAQFSHTL